MYISLRLLYILIDSLSYIFVYINEVCRCVHQLTILRIKIYGLLQRFLFTSSCHVIPRKVNLCVEQDYSTMGH